MHVTKTSLLEAPPEWVWENVLSPAAMQRMSEPLVSLEPEDPAGFPQRWEDGETYEARVKLFGLVPVGTQTIAPRRVAEDDEPGQAFYRFEDDGHGTMFPTWNHVQTVRETSDGRTAYTDDIEFGAGLFTPLVYPIVELFVGHRHRRWREMVDQQAPPIDETRDVGPSTATGEPQT